MKKTFSFFLKIFSVGFFLMLISCENNVYEEALYKSKVKVSYVKSSFLESKPMLMEKIKNSKAFKKNSVGRIITDTVNGYSIDTDRVKYIKGGNYDSFTFEIIKPDKTFLDNLVLISKPDGKYKSYALRYTLTEEEKAKIDTPEEIDFTNKCKVSEIAESESLEDILNKFGYNQDCTMVYSWQEVITVTPCPIDGCWGPEWTGTSVSHVLVGTLNCVSTSNSGSGGGDQIGTSPHAGGFFGTNEESAVSNADSPCPGDPVKNPKICPSSPSNPAGGTYGCTRNSNTSCGGIQGKKKHGGLDIQLPPGSQIFTMQGGKVVSSRDFFGASQYVKNSLGNFVEIESVVNGQTVRIKYCHLSTVSVNNGNTVSQAFPIATSGTSGNAAASGVTPHLHIQAKLKVGDSWVEVDPIDYLDTNFSPTTFQATGSKSNCQ